MNPTSEMLKERNLASLLREYDIRPSHQRLEIIRYLIESDQHPTVQRIYEDLAPANPTLSKTTVYNTLKLFVEKQLVREITIEGHEARYDIHDTSHGHFKCESCGRLYDIPYSADSIIRNIPEGFELREVHLHLRGICPSCRNSR